VPDNMLKMHLSASCATDFGCSGPSHHYTMYMLVTSKQCPALHVLTGCTLRTRIC
jgi:hypothetical protein